MQNVTDYDELQRLLIYNTLSADKPPHRGWTFLTSNLEFASTIPKDLMIHRAGKATKVVAEPFSITIIDIDDRKYLRPEFYGHDGKLGIIVRRW
jgi:hypothetical protein